MSLNPRAFLPGNRASEAAAATWMGAPGPRPGARHLLLETAAPIPAAAGVDCVARAGRCWLSGSPEALRGVLGVAGLAEAVAALDAFEKHLAAPPAPLVMGVLNVTPDSFSDGGQYPDPDAAVARGLEMVAEGAAVLDVGGESTRPGAAEVPAAEELARVLPVLRGLRAATDVLISVDTRKSAVAGPCLDAGADWINDVSALRFDPALAQLVAARPQSRLVLMHSRAAPAGERYSTDWDPAGAPRYEDVVADSLRELGLSCTVALQAGVRPEQLWLDPGFGFGKTYEQNVDLLRRLREYTAAGLPLLIGTSRKSTVGRLSGDLPVAERLEGTAATVAWVVAQGASAVRVHDVRAMARVARVAAALR
jgi:dihydropteroate synthase